jgi:DNA-binding NtrC family response regulator
MRAFVCFESQETRLVNSFVPEMCVPCQILIVDDEAAMLEMLAEFLSRPVYSVQTTTSGRAAICMVESRHYDVVILDLMMPEIDGISVLREIRKFDGDVSVIILSGFGTVEIAVEAMKLGADEFLLKPLQLDALDLTLGKIIGYRRLKQENAELRKQVESFDGNRSIVARSKKMADVLHLVAKVAPLTSTVLIQGESGTGKELLARCLHDGSPRSARRFVGINCAVIPLNLLESELFGYEKGAFTGAESRKSGYFEAAEGGTIFFDEISEMPVELQAKLLRVLQEKCYQRLGGTLEVPTDVRVIASTNRNLEEEVRQGRFRKDLFYRINVITIRVPPLRDRPEDISLLAFHFLGLYAKKFQKNVKGISPEVLGLFLHSRWDGNIRELENVIEGAVAVAEGEEIKIHDLTREMRSLAPGPTPVAEGQVMPFSDAKVEFERQYLETLLKKAGGNISQAARLASIRRTKLYEKLKKLGIRIRESD